MCTKEQIQEAKQYLSEQGYGTGSNFTVNAVANLMAEWLAKKCNIPHVSSRTLVPVEIKDELQRRIGIIESETDDFTRQSMISNLTIDLI